MHAKLWLRHLQWHKSFGWLHLFTSHSSWLFIHFFFYIYKFYLFIYWLCWVFIAARRLSLVVASGGYPSLRCVGLSLRWLLLLRSTGSRRVGFSSCGSRTLERSLSSCGSRAQLLHGMWDLPRPGLEPVSPAFAGRFLTTAPPGKPWTSFFKSSGTKVLVLDVLVV